MKIMKKKLSESNEIIKKDFNIDNDSIPLDEQKKFSRLVEEKSYEFQDLKEKNYPNNLISNNKTEEEVQQILVIIKTWQIYLWI